VVLVSGSENVGNSYSFKSIPCNIIMDGLTNPTFVIHMLSAPQFKKSLSPLKQLNSYLVLLRVEFERVDFQRRNVPTLFKLADFDKFDHLSEIYSIVAGSNASELPRFTDDASGYFKESAC